MTNVLTAPPARKHASAFFDTSTGLFSRSDHRRGERCARSPQGRVRPNGPGHVRGGDILNNRYHDPTTGVFISVDPLVSATGYPYLYGDGNPVTYADPSGLCSSPLVQVACPKATPSKPALTQQIGYPVLPGVRNYGDMQLVENWMSGDGGYVTDDYADPFGMGICAGALACEQAWKHWLTSGQDAAALTEAKLIATYYCAANVSRCGKDEVGTLVAQRLAEGISLFGAGIISARAGTGGFVRKTGPEIDAVFQFPGAGRSGAGVKNFVGPSNAVVRGASAGRVYVTDAEGRVIADITTSRVKPVVPGQGFIAGDGRKLVPTAEQLSWIEQLWGAG